MIVAVSGDREWIDEDAIRAALEVFDIDLLVHGGCRGADKIAGDVAEELGITVEEEKADWGRYSRAAGPIRNQLILDKYAPDLLIAFHPDLSRSRGTKDMVKRARRMQIPIVHVSVDE